MEARLARRGGEAIVVALQRGCVIQLLPNGRRHRHEVDAGQLKSLCVVVRQVCSNTLSQYCGCRKLHSRQCSTSFVADAGGHDFALRVLLPNVAVNLLDKANARVDIV